jgi:hypothetical protein
MKKFQFGFLAACLLLVLSLSSCKKDIGQISFPETMTDTYDIVAGQKLDISIAIENLQDGQLSVSVETDNADYDFSLPQIEGNTISFSINAPDFIKEETKVDFLVEVEDFMHEEREAISRTITVTAKPEANLFRTAQKANCIISEPGKIACFKAFKGNSGDIVDFDTAKIIWQDQQNLVTKVVRSDDEIAAWLTAGVCGNALIGAYYEDVLVWTYHLWVINDTPAVAYEYTNADGAKFSFIDRNLGATAATSEGSATCLYYYWGNMHPYAGAATAVYDIEGNAVEYATEETATICSENSLDDIYDYAFTRPLTFFASNSNKTGNYEWLFIHKDAAKWEEKADLWGGVSGNKSVYDPCPEGYKVPSFAALDAFKTANTTQEKQFNGETANKNFIGWKFSNEGGSTFLPAAGDFNNAVKYEAYYNGENTFPTAYIWAADMQVANYRATCFKGTPTSAAPAGQPMGYALNVRCVKE